MITYAELTTEVIQNLEIASADLSKFGVVEKLNEAQLDLLNTLPSRYLSNATRTGMIDFTLDTALFQFPDDFIRFLQLRVDYTAAITETNRGTECLEWESDKHFQGIDAIATKNYPFVNLEIEAGFEVRPAPGATVTNGIWLKYIYRLPDIATGQNSLLHQGFKNLLIHRATQLCSMVDNYRPDMAGRFKKLYDEELQRFLPKRERPE